MTGHGSAEPTRAERASQTLVERLRAALDRAEEIARAVGQPHWREDSAFLTDMVIPLPSQVRERPGWIPMITPEDIRHMAANDPAHVLRTVAAHRKILDRHYPLHRDISFMATEVYDGVAATDEHHEEIAVCGRCVPKHSHFGSREDVPEYPCDDVRDLAAVYFPEETTE